MKPLLKFRILSLIAFLVIFLIIWSVLQYTFEDVPGVYRAAISGGLTGLLAPRVVVTKHQSGKQAQFVWILMKRPIST